MVAMVQPAFNARQITCPHPIGQAHLALVTLMKKLAAKERKERRKEIPLPFAISAFFRG
jgi:hypothetical protein